MILKKVFRVYSLEDLHDQEYYEIVNTVLKEVTGSLDKRYSDKKSAEKDILDFGYRSTYYVVLEILEKVVE